MTINLKKVDFSDIEFLWYLRNQLGVCEYSKNNRPVSWKEHINWALPIILGATNKKLLIIESQKKPVGQIRIDQLNKKEAEISVSISKEFRGKGFAFKSLSLALKEAQKQKKRIKIIAEIHKENIPSMKLFEKLKFSFKEKRGVWLKYIYYGN